MRISDWSSDVCSSDLLVAAIHAAGLEAAWAKQSYTRQREAAEAVEGAKKPETRARRIKAAIANLRGSGCSMPQPLARRAPSPPEFPVRPAFITLPLLALVLPAAAPAQSADPPGIVAIGAGLPAQPGHPHHGPVPNQPPP